MTDSGLYDMVGNLWELVADWDQFSISCGALFSNDPNVYGWRRGVF